KPSFSLDELKLIVETAKDAGVPTVAHASTKEGMRRSALAGGGASEDGNDGDVGGFWLMGKENGGFCPPRAGDAARGQYSGWRPGTAEPGRLRGKRDTMKAALEAGVTIVNGSDIGVFAHGDGARELELLVEFGLTPVQALKSATSVAAAALHMEGKVGA